MDYSYLYQQAGHRDVSRGVVTIYDYEKGLLYRAGAFQRVLGPGRHRIWPFSRQRIVVVDTRRAVLQIANQKVLTSDQVTVTLNLVADYRVADPAAACHNVADAPGQLYLDVQLAARTAVGALTVDQLLAERGTLGTQIRETVVPLAAAYGLELLSVGLKDVILSQKVRDLLMKEVEARRLAAAMLTGAREEVAALRAMANAARLAEQHPHLLRLRELATVRDVAQAGGNTVVVGLGGAPVVGAPVGGEPKPAHDYSEPDDADE